MQQPAIIDRWRTTDGGVSAPSFFALGLMAPHLLLLMSAPPGVSGTLHIGFHLLKSSVCKKRIGNRLEDILQHHLIIAPVGDLFLVKGRSESNGCAQLPVK